MFTSNTLWSGSGIPGVVAKICFSFIDLGFGYVSVSDGGFVFGLNTINTNNFTINDTLPQPKPFSTKPSRKEFEKQFLQFPNQRVAFIVYSLLIADN
jgi:hypothetical protein